MVACGTGGLLIREVRTGEHPYNIAYEYDPGGNRTREWRILNCEF
jgi:hypothetical protein